MTAFGKHYDEKEIFRKVIIGEFGPTKPVLCKFAQDLLDDIPRWFWMESASSSGKFHPDHELGEGGLARHSLMVYRWLDTLLEANEQNMSDFVPGMDFACLFHDCCKRGMPGEEPSDHTLFEHPVLAAKFVIDSAEKFMKENRDFIDSTADDEDSFKHDVAVAASCIEAHMGKFNTSPHSEVVLPRPKTAIQYMVHLADYCASRKFTKFDFDWFMEKNYMEA